MTKLRFRFWLLSAKQLLMLMWENLKLTLKNIIGFCLSNPSIIIAAAIVIVAIFLISYAGGGISSCNDRRSAEKAEKKLLNDQKIERAKLEETQKAETAVAEAAKAKRDADRAHDAEQIRIAGEQVKAAEEKLANIKAGNYNGTSVEELERKAQEFENENP